jgi:hypothetical protein
MGRHDTTSVLSDLGGYDLEMGLQGGESPCLILPHEAAIPGGVGAQDRGKLPFLLVSRQWDFPRMGKTNKRTSSGEGFFC